MKRSHLILLLLAAGMVGTLIATLTSTARSVSFAEARTGNADTYKVSGTLVREAPVAYDPQVDAGLTRFTMQDREGNVAAVHLYEAKPTGLENSESIDLYGHFEGDTFHADRMLMKCPSKYNEQNHVLGEGTQSAGA